MKAGNYDGRIVSKYHEEFFKVLTKFENEHKVKVIICGCESDDYLTDNMDWNINFEDSFYNALKKNDIENKKKVPEVEKVYEIKRGGFIDWTSPDIFPSGEKITREIKRINNKGE